MTVLATTAPWNSHDTKLIITAVLGILLIVALIAWAKVHPFLALIIGSAFVGLVALWWAQPTAVPNPPLTSAGVIASFEKGVGSTLQEVGLLIALGAMLGKLMADSGGADRVIDTLLARAPYGAIPWLMALVAVIIGLPMFFEIGLVLLLPVIVLITQRSGHRLMRIAIPGLAGLSALHGLVPPHPGPLLAISAVDADLGRTLAFGILIAIPAVIISGPLFSYVAARWVPVGAPATAGGIDLNARQRSTGPGGSAGGTTGGTGPAAGTASAFRPAGGGASTAVDQPPAETPHAGAGSFRASGSADSDVKRQPSFAITLCTILFPVMLMLSKAVADIIGNDKSPKPPAQAFFDFIGEPLVAMTLAVLLAMVTFGYAVGFTPAKVSSEIGASVAPIAAVILIVGAGGGFKQVLVDSGVGMSVAKWANGASISVVVLGYLIAVALRLATGSATVATITAAGIVAPLVTAGTGTATHSTLPASHAALLALAIGCGSLFFSHVNDAGFWLVKELFGLSVGQTLATWSVMETLLSLVGFGFVELLWSIT